MTTETLNTTTVSSYAPILTNTTTTGNTLSFGGYTCANCGQWVYCNGTHLCPAWTYTWYPCYPSYTQQFEELKEMIKELKEVIDDQAAEIRSLRRKIKNG